MLWEAWEDWEHLVNLEIFLQLFVYKTREITVPDKISGSCLKILSVTSLELLESQNCVSAHFSTFHFLLLQTDNNCYSDQWNNNTSSRPFINLEQASPVKKVNGPFQGHF